MHIILLVGILYDLRVIFMKNRVNYVDNLRWLTVSLLIFYHAAMAYNTWDEANYIHLGENKAFAAIVTFISPWFMPLMFLLAGVSASYSLRKRGYGRFIKERLVRLGLPLLVGTLTLVPVLTYIADKTHNGYAGSFFEHYSVFFTKFTDLTGYDGGFSLAHLWFLAVLIIISLVSCVFIILIKLVSGNKNINESEEIVQEKKGRICGSDTEKGRREINIVNIKNKAGFRFLGIILGVVAVAAFDIRTGGKPLVTFLAVFLLGYCFFSDQDFVAKLARLKWLWAAFFIITAALNMVLFIYVEDYEILNNICWYASLPTGILALITIGHDHLDFTGRFSSFNSKISYLFYIIHFTVVVLCQFLLERAGAGRVINFVLTVVIAYPVTYMLCFVIYKLRHSGCK